MSLEPERPEAFVIARPVEAGPCAASQNKESPRRLLSKPPGTLRCSAGEPASNGPRALRQPSPVLERAENRLRHVADRLHAVDLDQLPARAVVRGHDRGIAVVGCEPRLEDFRIVVLPDRFSTRPRL